MFWNDLDEIKVWMQTITNRLVVIETELAEIKRMQEEGGDCESFYDMLKEIKDDIAGPKVPPYVPVKAAKKAEEKPVAKKKTSRCF